MSDCYWVVVDRTILQQPIVDVTVESLFSKKNGQHLKTPTPKTPPGKLLTLHCIQCMHYQWKASWWGDWENPAE